MIANNSAAGVRSGFEHGKTGATHPFRLLAVLAAVCLSAAGARATTNYVRGDVGNDANDGLSPASAFKTIQKGADVAQPGDTVLVYGGTYRERVKPPRGGTNEDSRITYLARPGDHVIITALDPWSPSWTAYGGSYPNLYYATPPDSMFTDTNYVDGGNPFKVTYMSPNNISVGQVVVDGVEYAEKTSLSNANGASQSWYANRTTGTIYVNFGGSPSGHNVEITTRRGVFRPYLKGLGYITVQGFDLAYCGNNACAPGVMNTLSGVYQSGLIGTRQGNHWKIIGNTIRNAKGVGVTFSMGTDIDDWYGWDCHGGLWQPPGTTTLFEPHLEVVNPYIWDGDNEIDPQNPTVPSPSRPFKEVGFNIIADNVIANCGMNAIAGITSLANTIYGNCFSNNCRFISGNSAEDAIVKMHLQYFDLIEKNLFVDGPGNHRMLWLDNNVVGTVVSRNVFLNHANGTPAVFLEISSSPDPYLTVLDNNLFINCSHGIVSAVADGVALYHNLFFRCGDGIAMGSNRSPMSGGDCGNMRIHCWNNLFVDQPRAFGFGFNQQVNFHSSDYNLMLRTNGTSYCKYLLTENGTGDGGDRTSRPWCTTYYSQSDITAARAGSGSYWSSGVNWGAANGPNGCESDLPYWQGTMGANIDLHSVERPYPGTSYGSATTRTVTLNLGSDPSIAGAPAKDGARLDFFGNVIGSSVKAGCFQGLGSGTTTYTFWDDANLPALPALPAAPSNVVVTTLSPTNVLVTWNNNAPDARYLHIERRINGGPWTFWGCISTTQNSMQDYAYDLDTGANLYEYRVAARNAAGLSPFAYVQSATNVPLLKVMLTATNTAVVSWPWPSTGWQLQQNNDLGTTNWATSLETVNNDGTNNFIIVYPPGNRFYRLFKPPPMADFTGTPTSGSWPLTVNFTDASSNNPTSWSWTFGDGGTSSVRYPSHQYTSAGSYTVSLTVTNIYGSNTKTRANYITVIAPQLPVADFTGTPTAGARPLTVNFTDTSSNYPTSWAWTFGDGGTSTVPNPSHQYTSAGNYTVSLTVSNAAGTDGETKNNYVTVTNLYGASIGVEFYGANGVGGGLSPTSFAGVVAQTNWHAINLSSGVYTNITSPLTDDQGNTTTVRFSYAADDGWQISDAKSTPDQVLMNTYIACKHYKQPGTVPQTIQLGFTNVPAGSYDVFIYGDVVNSPPYSTNQVTVSGTSVIKYWMQQSSFNGTYTEVTSTSSNSPTLGNYVHFTGVSPDANGNIAISVWDMDNWNNGYQEVGVNAVQLLSH